MNNEPTYRTKRGATVTMLPTIVFGWATLASQSHGTGEKKAREAQLVKLLLDFFTDRKIQDIIYGLDRIILSGIKKKNLSKHDDDCKREAHAVLFADFTPLLFACLCQDFPRVFESVLQYIDRIITNGKQRRSADRLLVSNPLAAYWALLSSYEEKSDTHTPMISLLQSQYMPVTGETNVHHVAIAAKFLGQLRGEIEWDGILLYKITTKIGDPGYEKIMRMKLYAEHEPPQQHDALVALPDDIPQEGERVFVLRIADPNALGNINALLRHYAKDGVSPEEILASFLSMMGGVIKKRDADGQ